MLTFSQFPLFTQTPTTFYFHCSQQQLLRKHTITMSLQQQKKQQQQQPQEDQMQEYHTIQVFREADMILEQEALNIEKSDSYVAPAPTASTMPQSANANDQTELDLIPYDPSEDGIGGDWAIDMDMDDGADDDVPPPATERRGSESTLYSFYFETPVLEEQKQEEQGNGDNQDDDDFTITSQETESFHNTTDLSLENLQDSALFWETGLDAAVPTATENDAATQQRCISPAHVSLAGEEPKQQAQQPTSPMC